MDKAADPFKASSNRKSPNPRHPRAVVTKPAFFPDAVFITSEPGMTLFTTSTKAEMERLRVHSSLYTHAIGILKLKKTTYYHFHHYLETLEELYACESPLCGVYEL